MPPPSAARSAQVGEPLPSPAALQLGWHWLAAAVADERDPERWLRDALDLLRGATAADSVAVIAREGLECRPIAQGGRSLVPPEELIADALDVLAGCKREAWRAAPLDARGQTGLVLAVHVAGQPSAEAASLLNALAPLAQTLGQAHRHLTHVAAERAWAQRLTEVLAAARNWNQAHELEPQLVEMAEAAQRLLEADRASIFLWDRASHSLVGRPALGVPGGELHLPDDRGVVGSVVQSGLPLRVGPRHEPERIDHDVDRKLGYRTDSIVCVPLEAPGGERLGAFEAINKRSGEFTDEDQALLQELASHAAVSLRNTQERAGLLRSRQHIADEAAQRVRLVGHSPAIDALRSTIARVAPTDLAVLVLGENGTGKEVVSQSIHYLSPRRHEPFIAVNCAALSETLLESELFGHEKGAFTDAKEARPGKFELASGGTLFLDEIGEMSRGGQAKLLRVLEDKVIVRVGGAREIATDVRVIAATNRNLAELVRQKQFREDLFYRLNVVVLDLPPLRARGDDVLELAEFFLALFARKARRKPLAISAEARRRLREHAWPGNVRELRNLMERLAYLSTTETIEPSDLAFAMPAATSPTVGTGRPLSAATDAFQIDYIQQAIAAAGGNVTEAATRLGVHRSNLYRKMRQLGMEAGAT